MFDNFKLIAQITFQLYNFSTLQLAVSNQFN